MRCRVLLSRAAWCAGAAAVLLTVGIGSGGCARRIAEGKAAAYVNALAPRYVGPADKWDSHIDGDSLQAVARGHIRRVHMEGQNVLLQTNFKAESVTLDFSDVAVNLKENTLESVGEVRFSCRIGSENLDTYVRSLRASGLRDMHIGLTNDRIVVTARPEVLGVAPVPVRVEGFLTPRDNGTFLDFTPDTARVSIIPVPGLVLPYIARKLNPTLDMKNLRVPIQITQAVVMRGVLVLRGTIAPADLLRAAQNTH